MKTTQFRFPIMSVFSLLFLCTSSLTADVVRDSASSPSRMISSSDGTNLIDGSRDDIVLGNEDINAYADTSDGDVELRKKVVWEGGHSPANVYGGKLIIDGKHGDIVLDPGITKIYARKSDVVVKLRDNPVVRASKRGESQLVLHTTPETRIIFLVERDDLTFKGSQSKKRQTPLLLFVVPGSNVDFVINGRHDVSFTADKSSGGTYVFVGMSDENPTNVAFIRNPFSFDVQDNVGIHIGRRSVMSFASQNCHQSGAIIFDPTNQVGSAGRMVLNIAPTGGFIVRPSTIKGIFRDFVHPTLANIDMAILGGGESKVEIINTGNDSQASLQVVNANDRLFDLLADPFLTLDARNDVFDYNGLFSGVQHGFVLGANGILDINDNAFLDYVGLANNVCPLSLCLTNTAPIDCCDCCITNTACPRIPCFEGCDPESLTKQRNPSAFFVDGSFDPCSTPAQIFLGEQSAIFFRSGVDCAGFVKNPFPPFQFTVNPNRKTAGAGEIVFDVEGKLQVHGSNGECSLLSKLEILSLEVASTGGPLFYNGDEVIFPSRTCNMVDCCTFRAYNSASFLVNNRLELFDTVLVHTDQNHKVIRNNDICSEPTYVGGEIAHLLECCVARPKIVFYNSRLFVHTDVAFTGLDLVIPNLTIPDETTLRKHSAPDAFCVDLFDCDNCDVVEAFPLPCLNNVSEFRFFYNGNKLDNGIGRQMILGTHVGSLACNECSLISADTHLDVVPEGCCDASGSQVDQILLLTTAANNGVIICPLDGEDVTGQFSQQTIFLGNGSNISIGEQIDSQANCF